VTTGAATHVDDLAALALEAAAGPTIASSTPWPRATHVRELVLQIRDAVGSGPVSSESRRRHCSSCRSARCGDARRAPHADECRSMAAGLADSDAPATGTVRVSQWLAEHGDTLGYALRQRARSSFRSTGEGDRRADGQ